MGERITFGGYQPETSVHTKAVHCFADALARITDGAVTVDFTPNISDDGHQAADLFDMVERDDIDGFYFSSSYLTARVPALILFDQHFAVPNRAQAYALLDGPVGQRMAEEVAANTGYIVFDYWDNGLRHISTSGTALTTPSDCVGLSLRTLPSPQHQRIFASLGFDPQIVDVSALQNAVKTGRIDAQENPLTNTFNFGLHDTHRTITLTGHLLGVAMVMFNKSAVARWSPEVKAAVQDALEEAGTLQRQLAQQEDARCMEQMKKQGVTFVTLTEMERTAFANATKKEVDATRTALSGELVALFESELTAQHGEQL
ncbi:TRAP transporter substrate-binding protein [Planktotalea sp.]|uniref:TRAP transporter substrate-binding protein n=1 Tax=Planktotalea sp. TaxID=2029877 RepID=UPI0032979C00